jgi:hypothetical protein
VTGAQVSNDRMTGIQFSSWNKCPQCRRYIAMRCFFASHLPNASRFFPKRLSTLRIALSVLGRPLIIGGAGMVIAIS